MVCEGPVVQHLHQDQHLRLGLAWGVDLQAAWVQCGLLLQQPSVLWHHPSPSLLQAGQQLLSQLDVLGLAQYVS